MRDTLFALDKRNRAHGVEIDRQCQNYEIKKIEIVTGQLNRNYDLI